MANQSFGELEQRAKGGDSSADLALADLHDAAGNHDEAIDCLARATRRGDVEATTRLGKRLLTGDRSPLLPREGTDFLIEAAQKGGAEAALRVAVLAACGAYVQQSWSRAVELLVLAAERGSGSARGQLRALAGEAAFAAAAPAAWRDLARAIDWSRWTHAAPGETLHAAPLIRRFPRFVPDAVGAWLIEQSRGKLTRARVYDAFGGQEITSSTRTNTIAGFNLAETDLVHLLVQARISATCGLPLSHMEASAVLHYGEGEQIQDHFDFVSPSTPGYAREIAERGERVITFLVYLNDDYEGGETDFPRLGVRYRGARGDGLLFVNALPNGTPDERTLHAGLPPIRGEKWILSQFVRSKPIFTAARH